MYFYLFKNFKHYLVKSGGLLSYLVDQRMWRHNTRSHTLQLDRLLIIIPRVLYSILWWSEMCDEGYHNISAFFLGGGEGEVQSAGARVLSGFFFLPFVLTSALSLSQGVFAPVSPAHPAFLLRMFVKQESRLTQSRWARRFCTVAALSR